MKPNERTLYPMYFNRLIKLNTVKAIKHPHILQYVEDMIDDKRIIIIQEYC
jgi:hypothetical protein